MNPELGKNVGKFADDGSVAEDVLYCAFTGQWVRGVHSNRERITGTPFFYRLSANDLHRVTDQWRAEFAAAVRAAFGQSGTPEQAAPTRNRKPEQAEVKPEG